MANFVTDNTPLPPLKVNASPPVNPMQEIDAEDVNNLWAAAGDLRTAVQRPDSSSVLSTGSTTRRILADRFADVINVKDYGLACNNVTNDYPALAAMLTLLGTTAATLVVPGPCVVNTNITIPATLPVRFEGAGAFTGTGTVTFTRWSPGGSAVGTSSLFTAAPRIGKLWTIKENGVTSFTGVGVSDPTTFGTGSRTFVTGADRFWLQFTLLAASNSSSIVALTGPVQWTRPAQLPKFTTRVRLNSLTNIAVYLQICSSAGGTFLIQSGSPAATVGGTDADAHPHASIIFDSRASTNWFCGSGDGVTSGWNSFGVVANMTDDWLLTVEWPTGTSIKFTLTNCTTGVSVPITRTTLLPSSTLLLGPQFGTNNWSAAANTGPYCEYVYMEHN